MTLPDETKPSALLIVLDYLVRQDGLLLDPKTMTAFNAANVLQVAIPLHLSDLEKKLLTDVISQQLTRETVLAFLT